MKEYIKISQYAKQHNICYRTAWKHYHAGQIPGYQDPDTGTIYLEKPKDNPTGDNNRAALYARVSSTQNKKSLDGQLERLRAYAAAQGYRITSENTEVASGLNENRKTLWSILNNDEGWDILIVEHKDRLTRFGYRYLEELARAKGKQLITINETQPKDKNQELMEDFISIITCFCSRLYGSQRKKRTQEIIDSVNKNTAE